VPSNSTVNRNVKTKDRIVSVAGADLVVEEGRSGTAGVERSPRRVKEPNQQPLAASGSCGVARPVDRQLRSQKGSKDFDLSVAGEIWRARDDQANVESGKIVIGLVTWTLGGVDRRTVWVRRPWMVLWSADLGVDVQSPLQTTAKAVKRATVEAREKI
jgi:hypothetical protein